MIFAHYQVVVFALLCCSSRVPYRPIRFHFGVFFSYLSTLWL